MRRLVTSLSVALSLLIAPLHVTFAITTTPSFSNSFAVQTKNYEYFSWPINQGDGSGGIIEKSGTPNYLRAESGGWVSCVPGMPGCFKSITNGIYLAEYEAVISSEPIVFTGTSSSNVKWGINSGTFSYEDTFGIPLGAGVTYTHKITLELVNQTTNKVLATKVWKSTVNRCGLLAPGGITGCTQPMSGAYPSNVVYTSKFNAVKKNDKLLLRIRVSSRTDALGIAVGLKAYTYATNITGAISW